MGRVAPREASALLDPEEAVHGAQPVTNAVPHVACAARRALTAAEEDLEGDPVALDHAPPAGRLGADALDHADDLMAGHEGPTGVQGARVLLVVGAAQAARLDP